LTATTGQETLQKTSWRGEYSYLLKNLILKDFRVRYRNMSLGMLWSLLNPLVMMGVLTFVFTRVYPQPVKGPYALFVLCGIVPYNFFTLSWATSTVSLIENTNLIKKVAMPREIIPISTVLGNCVHLGVQVALLLLLVLIFGGGANLYWLWLPLIWALVIVFVCGVGLVTAALDVYIRDMRYVVESANTVLFWLVPIFYPFERISPQYRDIYLYNPIAAVVMAMRNILLDHRAPAESLLWRLALVSAVSITGGLFLFHRMKRRFYEYL
jgi:ABC-type polysaccharide/polyol phosphate export permease